MNREAFMKNLFVLLIVFLFCPIAIFSQSEKVYDSSIGVDKAEVSPLPNVNTAFRGGPLLSEGILETSFPDYSGNLHPFSIAFNGTYYFVVGGGNSPGDVAMLDASFNLITTQNVSLDCRSVFYNPADGNVYIKGYTDNGLFMLHTSPFDGGYDVVFTGLFQNNQSKVCISPDGQYLYDHLDGNVVVYDFNTGLTLNNFTLNVSHNFGWPRGNLIAHTGTYLLTFADNVVYAYDPSNGNSISSCTLTGMPASYEWSMSYTNGMFFVADAAEATWYAWTIDDGAVSVEGHEINPTEFSLEQNYPNPFNPNTTISFQIPRSELIKIVVYNMLGKEVAVLLNEEREAGRYEVNFDGKNLSSGIYFYTINAGNFTSTRKMILMK